MPLSANQHRYLAKLRGGLEAGGWRMLAQVCPCQAGSAHDVCIAEVDRYGLPLNSLLCLACGTVRTDPYLDDASLEDFYINSYQEMYARNNNLPQLFDYQRTHYGQRIAQLYAANLSPRSAVLEVGCGTGGATVAFRERGCFVAGCDFSPELVGYGASRGLSDLWIGTIDNAPQVANRHYDLIYLFHVLEHISQPARLLAQLRSKLTPQGRILAVIPDLSRIDVHRNPTGDALKFLHIAHKFNFTIEGLARVASQAQLSAHRIMPPLRDESLLDDAEHLSELWIEFAPIEAAAGQPSPRVGEAMLRYLLATEQLFLAGQCPVQLALAARAAPPSEGNLPKPRLAQPSPAAKNAAPQRKIHWLKRLSRRLCGKAA